MNTRGDLTVGATGGLVASHTAVGTLPGDFCGINTTSTVTLAGALDKLNTRCLDKLSELYCERGLYEPADTLNLTGNYSDNLSVTAILTDSKKRLA